MAYIVRKFGQVGINIDDTLAGMLVDFAGQHPMDTMQLCSELYYVLLQARTTEPTAALARIAYERCLASLERVFEDEWQRLKTLKYAPQITKLLAEGKPPYPSSAGAAQDVSRTIRSLVDAGIVAREGRGRYVFTEAMFAEFVRRL